MRRSLREFEKGVKATEEENFINLKKTRNRGLGPGRVWTGVGIVFGIILFNNGRGKNERKRRAVKGWRLIYWVSEQDRED